MFGKSIMKDKRDYLTADEILRMERTALDEYDPVWFLLIRVLSRTGRRIREVVGLRPFSKQVGLRPIDLHGDNLVEWDILKKDHVKLIRQGKKRTAQQLEDARYERKPRRVLKYMDADTYEYLETYVESRQILPYKRIFPYTSMWVGVKLREIARDAGVSRWQDVHPHMFRHSFAINFLKANDNNSHALRLLQQILEHQNIDMTTEYLQFVPDEQKDSIEAMY